MRFPLSQPSLTALETAYVTEAITSGWISGVGPYVERLEAALAERLGRREVIVVSSGTTALEVTLQAMGIGPGDEVIVPALTFVAPAAAVRSLHADAVLADVDPRTWTIDVQETAALRTERTAAIIGVDLMGHPCDYDALAALGLPIIEDASQAHGASLRARPAGSFGLASIFSFHANKAISTGEGGCIATDDAALAQRIRLIVNHGMAPGRRYLHDVVGRNARMTNLTAALGCAQVERWDDLVAGRRQAGAWYAERIHETGGASKPVADWADPSCWLYTATFPEHERAAVLDRAISQGADVRPVWPALSDLPLYRSSVRRPCPVATAISATAVFFPTWSQMGRGEVGEVIEAAQ